MTTNNNTISTKGNGTALLDQHGRPAPHSPVLLDDRLADVHPLDDPKVWMTNPAHRPPGGVDAVQAQKWIDSIMGVTRENESIYKLVWSGDQNYWLEYYVEWDVYGTPKGEAKKRPMVRHKVIRDAAGYPVRDVFPPRWLILTRLEPEQYADSWEAESYVTDTALAGFREQADGQLVPEYRQVSKLVRPKTPPPVFWLWYATVARHQNGCCTQAEEEKRKCYGEYVSPYYMRDILGNQALADKMAKMTPFERVDGSVMSDVNDEENGYRAEIHAMQRQQEIFIENPMALIGIHAGEALDVDAKKGRQIVRDYFDREIEERSKLI